MKIKIIPIIAIILLILTPMSVIGIEEVENDDFIQISEKTEQISFAQLSLKENNDYISVQKEGANTFLNAPGKPMLPAFTKVYNFPKGTKIHNVEFTISEVSTQVINNKIEPAPTHVSRITIENNIEQATIEDKTIEDIDVYSNSDIYPEYWYSYSIHCGIVDSESSVILKVNSFPIRYSPVENTIYSIDSIDVQISYEEPENIEPLQQEYDLLIIAPRKFKLGLNSLVNHKNKMGVSTKLETVELINLLYLFKGRDKAERIKLFIRDAYEDWGIKYVLLVGGLKNNFYANDHEKNSLGSRWWYLPVRYTHLDEGYISDLYYADFYKYNESSGENEFEDWDSNGNGIFAEYREDLDLYPDVYFGRLPCRNRLELYTVVKKIINYEKTNKAEKDWYKRMIAVGGITFIQLTGPEYDGEEPDGEYLCNASLDHMESVINESVKVYASNFTGGPRPDYKNITAAFTEGAGFALLQGHGNAWIWDTKWPDATGDLKWVGGVANFDMSLMKNGGKLPIVVVGGCHNGIFNVTLTRTFLDGLDGHWDYHSYQLMGPFGMPVRTCFSWKMVIQSNGGAIACTGSTGYGRGYPLDPLNLSGLLETNFFYKIGIDNAETVGEAHSGSITKYLNEVSFHESLFWSHAYVIGIYELFGDPSLKIGGYATVGSKEK